MITVQANHTNLAATICLSVVTGASRQTVSASVLNKNHVLTDIRYKTCFSYVSMKP
jgi:hypothetical protein